VTDLSVLSAVAVVIGLASLLLTWRWWQDAATTSEVRDLLREIRDEQWETRSGMEATAEQLTEIKGVLKMRVHLMPDPADPASAD